MTAGVRGRADPAGGGAPLPLPQELDSQARLRPRILHEARLADGRAQPIPPRRRLVHLARERPAQLHGAHHPGDGRLPVQVNDEEAPAESALEAGSFSSLTAYRLSQAT